MMVIGFAVLLVVHGLIHLLGAAKGLGAAELPQLTQPISTAFGMTWLAASVLFLAAAVSLIVWPRWWWAVALCAVAISTVAIVPSWTDAKFGALANVIVMAGIAFGFLSQGPTSLRAEFERDVDRQLSAQGPAEPVTESDLAHLPQAVQGYLRSVGVVGEPRVRNFRVRMHGRIRDSRGGRWMPFIAEQYNAVAPASRLFYLNATMFAIPVQGYHRYVGSAASMRVKAAAVVPVAEAHGAEMTRAETVTLFNDMCIMAPATLIDPAIEWHVLDALTVNGTFTNAGQTVTATLTFNDAGDLVNFVSDDRFQSGTQGAPVRMRWSTPVHGYRSFGAVRLASAGAGRWHDAQGEYSYIELTIDDVRYNLPGR